MKRKKLFTKNFKSKFLLPLLILMFSLCSIVFADYNSENVSLIGRWPYGTCPTAFVNGQFAYIANGHVMEVLNVANPSEPYKIGEFVTESRVNSINILNNYAYIANWSDGFRVIDISNPYQPEEVAAIEFDGQCWNLSVENNYAYVGNDTLGLRIIDISDPTSPELKSTFCPSVTSGVEYAQVVDTLAYMPAKDGMYILNVSDPINPTQISYVPSDFGSYQVYVKENIAYLPEFDNGLKLINVSNPNSPTIIDTFNTLGSAMWFEIKDNYGYIANSGYESGLQIIDVSDPSSISQVTDLNTHYGNSFNILGNYLYFADSADGIKIIDISNPSIPSIVSSYSVGGYHRDSYVSGNYAFLASSSKLSILNISNYNNFVEIGSLNTDGAWRIEGKENILYLLEGWDLSIIDANNPGNPEQVAIWDELYTAAVYLNGIYAYLTGAIDLTILNIYNPSLPYEVGSIDDSLANACYDVCVSNNYAFVASADDGLFIFDITNPTNPIKIGSVPVNYAYRVNVSGSYAYVLDRYDGFLRVFDISTPSDPIEVGVLYTQQARDLAISDSYAYVINAWNGLKVIDISDPYDPTQVGFFDTKGWARGVFAHDDKIYVSDAGDFLILQNDLLYKVENEEKPLSNYIRSYPNPLTANTSDLNVSFSIKKPSKINIGLYNIKGQLVTEIFNDNKPSGTHSITSNINNLSSGIYFIKMDVDGKNRAVKKMVKIE